MSVEIAHRGSSERISPIVFFKRIELALTKSSIIGITAGYILSTIEARRGVTKLSNIAQQIAIAPCALCLPFTIKDVIKDVKSVITAKKRTDKIRSLLSFTVDSTNLVFGISTICNFLHDWKAVGQRAIKWIPIFNIVYFYVGFITTGLSVETAIRSFRTMRSLTRVEKKLSHAPDIDRHTILARALNDVKKVDLERLREDVYFSKQAHLAERVSSLAQKIISSDKEDGEAADLLLTLAKRAKLQFGFNMYTMVNNIVETVGAVFTTFTPLPIVGYIILATTGTVSCMVSGGKYLFINKNPLEKSSLCRGKRISLKAQTFLKTSFLSCKQECFGRTAKILAA